MLMSERSDWAAAFALATREACLECYKARSLSFVGKSTKGCLATALKKRVEVNSEDSQMTVERDGMRW